MARPNITAKDLILAQLALARVEDLATEPSADANSLESLIRQGYAAPGRPTA